MLDAGRAAVARLASQAPGVVEVEAEASHAAADVIFRTLFSIPIEHHVAAAVFDRFRTYQRAQPILNLAAFLPLPRWFPRAHRPAARRAAAEIRRLIAGLTAERMAAIDAGDAPNDLATKIMTTADPETGARFDTAEMVDQVAIFFLAGHETSASALGWGLYLLATHPEAQARVAAEARAFAADPSFAALSRLRFTRDVFRETLRLYPPVPMMVRQTTRAETFRGRAVRPGAQVVLSPWHLGRHSRIWAEPDAFDPDRWSREETRAAARAAYIPFSAGPRVCTGAGFAMAEGVMLLALLVDAFTFAPAGPPPVPVAHLTVRARDGIRLHLAPRA
jgi:cytochrome P450